MATWLEKWTPEDVTFWNEEGQQNRVANFNGHDDHAYFVVCDVVYDECDRRQTSRNRV